jgi:hypothetical protein
MKLYQKKLKEFKERGYKILSNKEKMKKPLLREMKVEVKGGRKLTYIYYFNKQTKEEWFKNISFEKAKEMLKNVKNVKVRIKEIKRVNNKNKFENKKRDAVRRYHLRQEKLTEELIKLGNNPIFESEKQKQDLTYFYCMLEMLFYHLEHNQIVDFETLQIIKEYKNGSDEVVYNTKQIDKKLLEQYQKIGLILKDNGIFNGTIRWDIMTKKMDAYYNKIVINTLKNEDVYFIVVFLEMLQQWRLEVKFKSFKNISVFGKIKDIESGEELDELDTFWEYLVDNLEDREAVENSSDVAKLFLREIYGIEIATSKEKMDLFKKLKGEQNV